ncbi:MAG: TlpA disulfide reductase family protein [Gemmatimonadota bacterium]
MSESGRKRGLGWWIENGLWVGVLAFALVRFWPQIAAATGLEAGDGEVLADFSVVTADGDAIRISDLRGRVVLVNYWASWCGPCRVEMPGFQDVYERHGARGFLIVGLSRDATRQAMADYARARGVTYPVALATAESVRAAGGLRGLPTSLLLDREGRIRHRVFGYFPEVALERAVRRLLAEPEAAAAASR